MANVVVFIDAQNLYNDARRAFCRRTDPAAYGQVDPMRLGRLLAAKHPLGADEPRDLKDVRIYRGRPDSTKQPKTYGAHMRQCAAWEKAGAIVIPRPLRYPHTWPDDPPEEKGIDVQIALDMVTMAINDELDVALLASLIQTWGLRSKRSSSCHLTLRRRSKSRHGEPLAFGRRFGCRIGTSGATSSKKRTTEVSAIDAITTSSRADSQSRLASRGWSPGRAS